MSNKFVSVEEEIKLNQEKEVPNTSIPNNIRVLSTESSFISNKQNSKLLSNEDKK